jgi:hypothetical protein
MNVFVLGSNRLDTTRGSYSLEQFGQMYPLTPVSYI